MNALLQIIPNLISLIKELPLKNKMIIMVLLIFLGGGYLFYDRYLDYKLATYEKPTASVEEKKTTGISTKVERINKTTVKIIAGIGK